MGNYSVMKRKKNFLRTWMNLVDIISQAQKILHNLTYTVYGIKLCNSSWVLVAHTCNPSYLGSWDGEDCSSKPAWAKSSQNPISKNRQTKMDCCVTEVWCACFANVKPWVQIPVLLKEKKSNSGAHNCNPSYPGGRGRSMTVSGQPRKSVRTYLKNKL
jgi:hypothetical protein